MSDKIDMRISGSSAMPGGEYGKVSISGSGKVKGNLKCDSMSCSGSGKVEGDVVTESLSCSGSVKVEGSIVCQGRLSTSGAFKCGGSVQAEELKCSGSFQAEGTVTGGDFRISGAMEAGAGVHCRTFHGSGSIEIREGLEAETVALSGKTEISGLLNAETVTIDAGGVSRIGDIGGSTITVQRGKVFGFYFRPYGLQVGSIEGDTVELEYTKASVVRGKRVVIGDGCKIGRVEYTESLQAQEGAVVEAVQV